MKLIFTIDLKKVVTVPIDPRYVFVSSQGCLKVYKVVRP